MSDKVIINCDDKFISWKKRFDYCNVKKLLINRDWDIFFSTINFELINKTLENDRFHLKIVPPPDLVFYPLNRLSPKKIKVIILGQSPYDNGEAMGASFSVPNGCPIPSSLRNIYRNLIKFGHLEFMPSHGFLGSWITQGVLMINCAFTGIIGNGNYYTKIWNDFTEALLNYLNENYKNLIFLVWGSFARKAVNVIDGNKHYLLISDHPSGRTRNSNFMNNDHFGKTNMILKKLRKRQIKWDSVLKLDKN